jgi:hypothetical protein
MHSGLVPGMNRRGARFLVTREITKSIVREPFLETSFRRPRRGEINFDEIGCGSVENREGTLLELD